MKFKKALGLAWSTFIHSKLRSWLTIIGIIIGIAAVVSIISVSQGAKISLENQLNNLGTNIITISPGASRATGAGATFITRGGGSYNLGKFKLNGKESNAKGHFCSRNCSKCSICNGNIFRANRFELSD